jgi:hypothetical protein
LRFFQKKEKPELSFSRVKTYRDCGYKFYLQYVERLHAPPTPASALGHSIHKALELYHEQKCTSLDDLLQAYNEGWEHEGFTDPAEVMEFYQKGEDILARYYEQDKTRATEILHAEKKFKIDLGFCMLRGVIDRIDRHTDGKIEVLDYKTHREIWKNKKIRDDLQLTIYDYACRKALGLRPDILSLYFLTQGKKISTTRGRVQEKEMLCLLKNIAKNIRKKKFEPCFYYCFRCDFKGRCDHAKKHAAADSH